MWIWHLTIKPTDGYSWYARHSVNKYVSMSGGHKYGPLYGLNSHPQTRPNRTGVLPNSWFLINLSTPNVMTCGRQQTKPTQWTRESERCEGQTFIILLCWDLACGWQKYKNKKEREEMLSTKECISVNIEHERKDTHVPRCGMEYDTKYNVELRRYIEHLNDTHCKLVKW